MASTRLTLPDYRALADFRYHLRRFISFSDQAARAAGVEPHQHQLLLAVKGMPEGVMATMGAIAERLQIRHHSTVELVDRMEGRGLVRRLRSVGDRRQVLVVLTDRGESLLARLAAEHRVEVRSIGPALLRALGALVAKVEHSRAAGAGQGIRVGAR